jgi:hypothetical protein
VLLIDDPANPDDGVGRCALTPPDPQLKGARYPGGFNPCTYQAKKPVSKFCLSQVHNNLHRYNGGGAVLRAPKWTPVGLCTLNQVDP